MKSFEQRERVAMPVIVKSRLFQVCTPRNRSGGIGQEIFHRGLAQSMKPPFRVACHRGVVRHG